jgi:hypothetical protein
LGDEFIAEVSAAFDPIGDGPESSGMAWHAGSRTVLLPVLIALEKHEQHLLGLVVQLRDRPR